jgi:hypothetical protein
LKEKKGVFDESEDRRTIKLTEAQYRKELEINPRKSDVWIGYLNQIIRVI